MARGLYRNLGHRAAQVRVYLEAERARGKSPSYGEICADLDFCSKADVHRVILSLERRGIVKRDGSRWGRKGQRVLRLVG